MAFMFSIKTVVQGYHVAIKKYEMQQWIELSFLAKETLVMPMTLSRF